MATFLFSKKILSKYPDIFKQFNINYDDKLNEYKIFSFPTDHFFVKDLNELTDDKIESEIEKQKNLDNFRTGKLENIHFNDDEFGNDILKEIHGRI